MAARFIARQVRTKPLALTNLPPMVSFTFDDVPSSACERGARILEDHGARATYYVAGGSCGTTRGGGPPLASGDQIGKLWADGHEIGCHTYSHTAVRYMSRTEIGGELERNQSFLRNIDSDIVVRNFAYPYGDMSVRTKRFLEARFDSCRSVHAGINTDIVDLGALNAWPLESASLDRPKIGSLIDEAVRHRGWLIFYTHDVADNPSRFGVSPDLLEFALGAAQKAGCAVTTVAQSLNRINAAVSAERLANM